MEKKDFILKQLARTYHKRFENYVITRIIHKLDDPDVKFITQQYIRRPNGYALVDLYFPQLGIYVEVNEFKHNAPDSIHADKARKADIVSAVNLTEMTIEEHEDITLVNRHIDQLVEYIKDQIKNRKVEGVFELWNPVWESSSQRFIELGYLNAYNDISFKTHADACNCFGHRYKAHCTGAARHPYEPDILIWFPKLYENDKWENSISDDGSRIHEREKNNDSYVADFLNDDKSPNEKRIVFAHVIGPMGEVRYRFKGLYELDRKESETCGYVTYYRISKQVRTYRPIKQ